MNVEASNTLIVPNKMTVKVFSEDERQMVLCDSFQRPDIVGHVPVQSTIEAMVVSESKSGD